MTSALNDTADESLPQPAAAVDGPSADPVIDLLAPLLKGRARTSGAAGSTDTDFDAPPVSATRIHGMVVGELLAIAGDGQVPLVRFPGQAGSAAIAAGSTIDLQGHHIGQPVTLLFDQGDPERPIVMGVLRGAAGWPLAQPPASVSVDEDGERLIVSAHEQLVLRCGKASITLTKAGKVLIDGSYVLSRSTGVNRVKGGSVQLN